jgi:hypothetical protein
MSSLQSRKNKPILFGFFLSLTLQIEGCSFRELKVETGFSTAVSTLVQEKCVRCHSGSSAAGGLYDVLDSDSLVANGYISLGDAAGSLFYQKLTEAVPYGDRMPKGGPYLTATEISLVGNWIDSQPVEVSPEVDTELLSDYPEVSFSRDIVPILTSPLTDGARTNTRACVGCHNASSIATPYYMADEFGELSHSLVVQNGTHLRVIPGDPLNSWLCQKVKKYRYAGFTGQRMPNDTNANPVKLTTEQVNQVCHWIKQGALNN